MEPSDEHADAVPVRSSQTFAVVLLDQRAVQALPATGTVTIGRARDAHVFIDHISVSREHAMLDVESMTLTDLGSRNGRFLGGERLQPNTPILIIEALDRFGGNQTSAARALGLSRTTLVARMEAYSLRRPRK